MSIVDGLNNIAQLVSPFAQSIDAFTAGLSIWGIIVIVYFSVLGNTGYWSNLLLCVWEFWVDSGECI